MSDIYMDIEQYRHAVAKLRQMLVDLDDSHIRMTSLMGFVGDAWQSAASDAFLEVNEWTVKDIEQLRFNIESLASDIEVAAMAFEDAGLIAKGVL